jgi:hypothetical protein
MNKKGFEESGIKFNIKNVSLIILFIVVLAVMMVLLWPRLSAQQHAEASTSFGKYIWDLLGAG